MRLITIDEQRELIRTLSIIRFSADMMTFDCICYGGPLKDYRDARDYVERAIKAIPEDIRNQYDAELRKAEADKLRAQADKIEQGTV